MNSWKNNFEFYGRIVTIGEIESKENVSAGTVFTKRIFVLATEEQHPQTIKFELQRDKVSLISPFFVGDEVRIRFNIRGTEWKSPEGTILHFTTFAVWKIEKVSWRGKPGQETAYVEPIKDKPKRYGMVFPPASEVFDRPQDDDLPF